MSNLLILRHIRIQNANALSSPYTIGFPAMTAWLGFTHALQRRLQERGYAVALNGTGVISHDMALQTYKGPNDFTASIIGTGNPLEPKTEKNAPQNAVRPSFIEEARCHLDVSLVITVTGLSVVERDNFCTTVSTLLNGNMRLAGGDILGFYTPSVVNIDDADSVEVSRLFRSLMPGYALVERRELMQQAMENGQDALDAMLDYLAVHHQCDKDDAGKVTWTKARKGAPVSEDEEPQPTGWIVPIAVGFQGLTPLAESQNRRDPDTLHRFAESVVTLGEFRMVYRLNTMQQLFWHYHYDEANALYLCEQRSTAQTDIDDSDLY